MQNISKNAAFKTIRKENRYKSTQEITTTGKEKFRLKQAKKEARLDGQVIALRDRKKVISTKHDFSTKINRERELTKKETVLQAVVLRPERVEKQAIWGEPYEVTVKIGKRKPVKKMKRDFLGVQEVTVPAVTKEVSVVQYTYVTHHEKISRVLTPAKTRVLKEENVIQEAVHNGFLDKPKAPKTPNAQLVCIWDGLNQMKRVSAIDAAAFIAQGGWKYITKQHYKQALKKPCPIPVVTTVPKPVTKEAKKEARKAQKDFIPMSSRRNRRFFAKMKGEPTYSEALRIQLDEIALTKPKTNYRTTKDGSTAVNTITRLPLKEWMPARYGLNDYKGDETKTVTRIVHLLPKSIQKWQFKVWGRTKYKDNPEALLEAKNAYRLAVNAAMTMRKLWRIELFKKMTLKRRLQEIAKLIAQVADKSKQTQE